MSVGLTDSADVLSELLEVVGLHGDSCRLRAVGSAPVIAIDRTGDLHLIVSVAGTGVLLPPGREVPVLLGPGDVLLLRGDAWSGGQPTPRIVAASSAQAYELISATMRFGARFDHPLLERIPPVLHLRHAEGVVSERLAALTRVLTLEVGPGLPGTGWVQRHLVAVMLVELLRCVSAAGVAGEFPGPLRDRAVYTAIQALHAEPARSWTVPELARRVNLSRSSLSARFRARTGVSPMVYLTRWRMALARRLLWTTDLPLDEIGRQVGYASDVAFNRAFRRTTGVPPGEVRRRGPPTGPAGLASLAVPPHASPPDCISYPTKPIASSTPAK